MVRNTMLTYKEKLENLQRRSPEDSFYKNCMEQVNSLSDLQKGNINAQFYRDPEIIDVLNDAKNKEYEIIRSIVLQYNQ
jgi:hypothetical protein